MNQDEIIEMPEYLNASYEGDDLYTGSQVRELMKLVAAKERARICAGLRQFHDTISLASDSKTIRARGEA